MGEQMQKPPDAQSVDLRIRLLKGMLSEQQYRLDGMVRIASNLGRSRDPRKAMREMVVEISKLLHADRTTIYELRNDGMLYGLAVQGETSLEVGVPLGSGVAGLVADCGESLNLRDAYEHPAFSPKFDKLTGYRSRSMLCVPMRNPKQEVIGVVQVLNKHEGYFSPEDEQVLIALAAQAAITLEALRLQLRLNLRNTELKHLSLELQQKVKELELLYENEQRMSETSSESELADKVLQLAAEVARCEAAALYLAVEKGPIYLRSAQHEANLEIHSLAHSRAGLLGAVMDSGEPLLMREGESKLPELGGGDYKLKDAVASPLFDGERVMGVLALLNRREPERREEEDLRLVVLLAAQLSRALLRMAQRDSARRRDRLMTIGQMMSGVLHDLKGPMTIISGYTQLMAEIDNPQERKSMSRSIRRQIALFNDMTREVMAFARGERAFFKRKVKLAQFIRAAQEGLRSEFEERGLFFQVDSQAEGLAFFDEPKVLRVVTNIARNARQALSKGGSLLWRIFKEEQDLIFEFEDDGPGIPEGIQDHLFEAFTTSGKKGGTGLGLAIARRIVEDHGGSIRFETEMGVGTRFIVRLPAGTSP